MVSEYVEYLTQLDKRLKREGIALPVDLSCDKTNIGDQVTVLEQFLYFNNVLKISDSAKQIPSLFNFDDIGVIEYLRNEIFEKYEAEWNQRLSQLVEQPKDAGVLGLPSYKLNRRALELFTESLNLQKENAGVATESIFNSVSPWSRGFAPLEFDDDEEEESDYEGNVYDNYFEDDENTNDGVNLQEDEDYYASDYDSYFEDSSDDTLADGNSLSSENFDQIESDNTEADALGDDYLDDYDFGDYTQYSDENESSDDVGYYEHKSENSVQNSVQAEELNGSDSDYDSYYEFDDSEDSYEFTDDSEDSYEFGDDSEDSYDYGSDSEDSYEFEGSEDSYEFGDDSEDSYEFTDDSEDSYEFGDDSEDSYEFGDDSEDSYEFGDDSEDSYEFDDSSDEDEYGNVDDMFSDYELPVDEDESDDYDDYSDDEFFDEYADENFDALDKLPFGGIDLPDQHILNRGTPQSNPDDLYPNHVRAPDVVVDAIQEDVNKALTALFNFGNRRK